jgi:hypothetical protein
MSPSIVILSFHAARCCITYTTHMITLNILSSSIIFSWLYDARLIGETKSGQVTYV